MAISHYDTHGRPSGIFGDDSESGQANEVERERGPLLLVCFRAIDKPFHAPFSICVPAALVIAVRRGNAEC